MASYPEADDDIEDSEPRIGRAMQGLPDPGPDQDYDYGDREPETGRNRGHLPEQKSGRHEDTDTLPTTNEGGMAPFRAIGNAFRGMMGQAAEDEAKTDAEYKARGDVGEPPIYEFGREAWKQAKEGWENVKNNPVVKFVGRAGGQTGNPHDERSLMDLVMGNDAAHPEAADKFGIGVQSEYPSINKDDVNTISVLKALQLGGPEAAWAMIQHNRKFYNANMSFARAALEGYQGKPPDLKAATDAATKASQSVLDGSYTVFNPRPDGMVNVSVRQPGTDVHQAANFVLTPPQFYRLTDIGQNHYDRVMQEGVGQTLTKIAQGGDDQQLDPDGPNGDGSIPEAVQRGEAIARDPADPAADQPAKPGTHDKYGRYIGPKQDDGTNYGEELENRSRAVFGGGPVTNEPDRQKWMNAQEQLELERQNKLDQAAERGKWADKRAATAGGYGLQREGVKQEAANGRSEVRAATSERNTDANITSRQKINDDNIASREKVAQGHDQAAMARKQLEVAQRVQEMAARTTTGRDKLAMQKAAAILKSKILPSDEEIGKVFDSVGLGKLKAQLLPQAATPTSVPQAPAAADNSEHDAAVSWARANPNDPKAQRILKLNGM